VYTLAVDDRTHYLELAAAYARGRLGLGLEVPDAGAVALAAQAGLRLHAFKRNAELPRVRRALGVLRGLGPESLLDVGSGRGVFLWPLLDELRGLAVTAIDRDAGRAAGLAAVSRGGVTRLRGLSMDATALAFGERSFDVVAALEVLEHLERPAAAAREALRVTRRALLVSVPSKPDRNPEHLRLYDARSLAALLEGAGAARVSIDGVRDHLVAVASVR
jgi:2-polyprenyl-3-methyl-5-hydroxy-6-metoxy-1,4-benzoquinol methylase